MDKASEKVKNLKKFNVTKDPEQVGSVMAYTDETPLYGELNLSMRKKGGLHEKKLLAYGEFIYHLDEAIGACENYIGQCYRALDVKIAPHQAR